jgi:microcystin degradation protein MlrC
MLDASVLTVHPFNNHPELGWSTLAISDGRASDAERYADELAEACWQVRKQLPPEFLSAHEAIRRARRSRLARRVGCVMFADTSDVVTAGAPVRARQCSGPCSNRAPIYRRTWRCAIRCASPRSTAGRSAAASSSRWEAGWIRNVERRLAIRGTLTNFKTEPGFRRMAVVDVGRTSIVLTEGPALSLKPLIYACVGLDPLRADVVVVKNFFPFCSITCRTTGRCTS